MGQLPTTIPKVARTFFRLIKLLMCKPKKYFGTNQRSCLRNISYFSVLVELNQSSVVYQLPMINQLLCTWVSEGHFSRGHQWTFRGKAKVFTSGGQKWRNFIFPFTEGIDATITYIQLEIYFIKKAHVAKMKKRLFLPVDRIFDIQTLMVLKKDFNPLRQNVQISGSQTHLNTTQI